MRYVVKYVVRNLYKFVHNRSDLIGSDMQSDGIEVIKFREFELAFPAVRLLAMVGMMSLTISQSCKARATQVSWFMRQARATVVAMEDNDSYDIHLELETTEHRTINEGSISPRDNVGNQSG